MAKIETTTKLAPNVDYYVTEDQMHIKIVKAISANDIVELIHFTATPTSQKFGFRQFKDVLNRVHYKRMDETNKYMLSQPLNWYDLKIELLDAPGLPGLVVFHLILPKHISNR